MNKIYLGDTNLNVLKLGSGDTVIYLGNEKIYPVGPVDYSTQYLTFVAEESGTFKLSGNTVDYSLDNGNTWVSLASNTSTTTVAAGRKIMWRASLLSSIGVGTFSSTGRFSTQGNVMSLLYGDNFINQTTLVGNDFNMLFKGCTGLTSTENFVLPATTLADSCYFGMFSGCTSLTSTPELPATDLSGKSQCYQSMFEDCTSLTTAPELPATVLGIQCYGGMFRGCTGLTSAPELSATALANFCYSEMFKGCTSLTTAPALPATTLAQYCYYGVFQGCTGLTSAPALPATTLVNYCYYGMFKGCTSLTTAPTLSSTTLTNQCYREMFSGCTSLNSVTCYATNISASNCTRDWLKSVAASGTFTKPAKMHDWELDSSNGIPSGWTVQNEGTDYSIKYLTTIAREAGTITINTTIAGATSQYSLDEGVTWSESKTNTNTTPTLQAGDRVMWRGQGNSGSVGRFTFSATTIEFDVEGNPMSLHYNNNTDTFETTCYDYDCKSLFKGTKVVDASNLDWGTVTTRKGCFSYMFQGCTSLTAAPSTIPAPNPTSGSSGYCEYMFQGCTGLTSAPELPATTLATYCYRFMFYNCTSLTTAPVLPATTLATYCYSGMFQGCTNLSYIKALFTTTPSSTYTGSWVDGVAANGTFVKSSSASWTTTGVNGIPSGWTVETAS